MSELKNGHSAIIIILRNSDFWVHVPEEKAANLSYTLDMLRAMQMNGLPGVQLRQGGFRK